MSIAQVLQQKQIIRETLISKI